MNDGVYPPQSCSYPWAEYEKVTVRGITVWENIRTVVNFWMILPKSKQPFEENKRYIRLKVAITDSLMLVKFNLFATTAKFRGKLLVANHTKKAMVPFLAQSI